MGGLDERGAVVRGDVAALEAEMRDAVRQTGGRRLILAGGCSVPDDIPADHLRSAARLIAEWA
jgi:uroporphyrinogen decarboxylase